jgi:hypothetical protein
LFIEITAFPFSCGVHTIIERPYDSTRKCKESQIFKDRFDPIFDISITNKEQTAIGIELPILKYQHLRTKVGKIDEETLSEVLSSGETTTYNVIKFIAKYENMKKK